jgi:uncharacterized surface protein with fasciclin (FAS1) repeats
MTMRRRILAILTATAALSVGLSACGSSGNGGGTSTPARNTSQSSSAPAPGSSGVTTGGSSSPAASALFGPGCASLGLTDAAVAQASQAPVGTVAANIPFLSNVVAAANAAGLTQTLNAAPALTVFAPVDDAFKKEPPAQVQALLTDPKMKPQLVATLNYHVLPGKVEKAALVGTHKTLQGTDITVTGSGDNYTVNDKAKIICGGIQTKNAVVYLIDTVLHPAS